MGGNPHRGCKHPRPSTRTRQQVWPARKSPPPAGRFLERADATPAETGALAPRPIEQPWIVRDPTVGARPGRRALLTLLMDPGGKVHATSGILPRKSIGLLRDWTAGALARIAPTFRIGPCSWTDHHPAARGERSSQAPVLDAPGHADDLARRPDRRGDRGRDPSRSTGRRSGGLHPGGNR